MTSEQVLGIYVLLANFYLKALSRQITSHRYFCDVIIMPFIDDEHKIIDNCCYFHPVVAAVKKLNNDSYQQESLINDLWSQPYISVCYVL